MEKSKKEERLEKWEHIMDKIIDKLDVLLKSLREGKGDMKETSRSQEKAPMDADASPSTQESSQQENMVERVEEVAATQTSPPTQESTQQENMVERVEEVAATQRELTQPSCWTQPEFFVLPHSKKNGGKEEEPREGKTEEDMLTRGKYFLEANIAKMPKLEHGRHDAEKTGVGNMLRFFLMAGDEDEEKGENNIWVLHRVHLIRWGRSPKMNFSLRTRRVLWG